MNKQTVLLCVLSFFLGIGFTVAAVHTYKFGYKRMYMDGMDKDGMYHKCRDGMRCGITKMEEIQGMPEGGSTGMYDSNIEDQDMGMMGTGEKGMTMPGMSAALQGKTGDEFDKAFIELMIEHHNGAIDMAGLAETSAKHQEIKDLSKAIMDAQMKEIIQMRQWLVDWGYDNNSQPVY